MRITEAGRFPGQLTEPTKKTVVTTPERGPRGFNKFIRSKLGRFALSMTAIASLAGLSIGVREAVDTNVPGISQNYENVPSTFDPNALKSVVGENNLVQMTATEYEENGPPFWDSETRTLSMPLAIDFKEGNRTLDIKRERNWINDTVNVITIKGLRVGDILRSPMDGEIEFDRGVSDLRSFSLRTKDPEGNNVSLTFSTTGLEPLISRPPINQEPAPIKKGDLIGRLILSKTHRFFDGQVQITGHAPLINTFNLAASSGKVIVLQ